MRGSGLSVFRRFQVGSSLSLALGACTLMAGCDSKSTAEKPDAAAPPANVAQAPAPASAAPVASPSLGDRYSTPAPAPMFDPAVRPAGYTSAPTAAQVPAPAQGPGLPATPTEPDFVPGVEDLQLFEQPNFDKSGKAIPTVGYGSEYLDWKVGQRPRTSPLPQSP